MSGPASDSDSDLDQTSIRIIEAGYRSINDPNAFDDLVTAWKSRIDALTSGAVRELLTPALAQHCDELVRLLDAIGEPLLLSEHDSFVRKALGPAMVISPTGTVIAINQSASNRFDLAVGQRTELGFLDFASSAMLDRLRDACRSGSNMRRAILQTEDRGKPDLLDAQVVSVDGNANRGIGLRTLGYDWSVAVHDLLVLAFDLSEAEAEVVGLLYKHADLATVAEIRSTSLRTVRTQMHQIYSKTGTSGQVELIRMVSLICAQEGRENSVLADWRDPLGREQYFTDDEGNTLFYSWLGAADGTPAILCHGPLTGHTFRAELHSALREKGIKLYAIFRPGFGNSAPAKKNVPAHEAGAQAVLALADHLGLEGIAGIGLVNGIVPLIHASAQRPRLFRSLLGLGSTMPLDPAEFSKLPSMQGTLFRLAHKSAGAFDAFVRTGYRAALKSGPEYALSRMYEGSPADQQTLRDPDIFALLKASTAMVMTQGHEAFMADVLMVSHDFTPLVAKAAPVTMVAGTLDPVYPVAAIREFTRKSGIDLIEVEGAGQTLCHSHIEPCAEAIFASVGRTR
ncbi:MAG: hypothetical protein AAF697_14260 [Pseudomonadota bacterium]